MLLKTIQGLFILIDLLMIYLGFGIKDGA